MYQALYRKYRPDTFSDVIGQEIITKTLKNAILHQKLTHAYLFTGPRGTGKTTIAKILAKTINCTDLKGIEPCNICVNCTQINQKQSTDIIEIDAASNNGVDEIREIRNKVNLVPSTSKYKIYIIDEVHMLTTGAFNALLKTLEEPPSHIIFILATTEPHKIPATILSRCQRFDFKKIPIKKLMERLQKISEEENLKITPEALEEIAYISDGGMRDAISILDQSISYTSGEINIEEIHEINGTLTKKDLLKFTEFLFSKNILELLNLIEEYNETGRNFIKLTEEIIIFLKNLLLYKTVPKYFMEDYNEYNKLSNNISTNNLIDIIELFNDSLSKIKLANDPTIIFELLIIKHMNLNETPEENTEIIKNINKKPKEIPISPKIEEQKTVIEPIESKENKNQQTKEEKSTKKPKNVQDNINNLKELQDIRINNTLSNFNKKILIDLKSKTESIKDLLLNQEYSQLISIILDGELKASSEQNLIFVYDSEALAQHFNEHLLNIEEILAQTYKQHFDVIATTKKEWEIIKTEFNSKKKEYKYIEENVNVKDLLNNLKGNESKDDINNLFGDIVEYN